MTTEPPASTEPRGSAYADRRAAEQALQRVLPMLEPARRDPGVCGSGVLCVVVMDPALRPGDVPFERAVLLEHALGDRDRWDADYAGFARAKARLSWLTGTDSAQVQSRLAHRLRDGDSLLGGGVCLDGIVVAVSGAFPWYDDAFALAIAAQLRALARARHAAALEAHALTACAGSVVT